jgi:hypothetical protein
MFVEQGSYRHAVVRIENGELLRHFVDLGLQSMMDFSFLSKAFCVLSAMSWETMNQVLAHYTKAQEKISPEKSHLDTTVYETNIHYPADSSLLWDSFRTLARLTARQNRNDPWEEPVNLGPTVNNSTYEFTPEISLDGLSLYFESRRRSGHGNYDIWVTTKETSERIPEGYWNTPINLGPSVNGVFGDQGLHISSDGLLLLLSTNRPGGDGNWDLWMTRRTTRSDAWGERANLGPKINASYLDGWPCLSPVISFLPSLSFLSEYSPS